MQNLKLQKNAKKSHDKQASAGQIMASEWQPEINKTIKSTADTLRAFLNEMDWFCNQLETTADLLPTSIDEQDCLLLAQNIVPLVHNAHAFEEGVVFPAVLADRFAPESIKASIERLKFEHAGDEYFADDLCLSLRQFVTDRSNANIESLTWMLRGFFEGLRRHVAFEREFILPLMTKN